MLQMVDLGSPVDLLTKDELSEALAEDARLRSTLAGVRPVEVFIPTSVIGAGVSIFSTSGQPPQAPANGYIWAVMLISTDLSASTVLNVYKGTPTAADIGGKPILRNAGAPEQVGTFSKGQLWLRPGDQLTFFPTAGNVLSVYMVVIEVPAERVGELLL
jgi:hypothetical protein